MERETLGERENIRLSRWEKECFHINFLGMHLKHHQVFLLIWGFLEGGGVGCVHPRTGTVSARRNRLENSLFCVITSGPCLPLHFP